MFLIGRAHSSKKKQISMTDDTSGSNSRGNARGGSGRETTRETQQREKDQKKLMEKVIAEIKSGTTLAIKGVLMSKRLPICRFAFRHGHILS